MIIFYGIILTINLGVLLNGQITLHYVLAKIQTKSRVFRFLTYGFMIITSYTLFPIGINQGYLSLVLIIVTYFYVGGVFYGLHPASLFTAFTVAVLLQGLGLYFRLMLRWEVYPAMNDLTVNSIVSYLIMVPLFITVVYALVPLFLKMEVTNYHDIKKKL